MDVKIIKNHCCPTKESRALRFWNVVPAAIGKDWILTNKVRSGEIPLWLASGIVIFKKFFIGFFQFDSTEKRHA